MAKIRDLISKYYGTEIELLDGSTITVWLKTENSSPSWRELYNGWTSEDGYDHVEHENSYHVAEILCEVLTAHGL